MAKKLKSAVKIERGVGLPKRGGEWPFADLGVSDVFYVPPEQHQAVRTAATRAKKKLGMNFSVRKIKAPKSKHNGMIGVFRTS